MHTVMTARQMAEHLEREKLRGTAIPFTSGWHDEREKRKDIRRILNYHAGDRDDLD